MSPAGLQLRTPGNRSRFGTLTQARRLVANSMLHLSHGSERPSRRAATRTRWRKSMRKARSRAFRFIGAACSAVGRRPTRPSATCGQSSALIP